MFLTFAWRLNFYIWQSPLGAWQAKCWDPEVGSTAFDEFCESLDKWIIPSVNMSAADMELPFGHPKRMVSLGQEFQIALDMAVLNYAKWIKEVSSPFVLIFTIGFVSFAITEYCFTL
jgi:hypothetical protein